MRMHMKISVYTCGNVNSDQLLQIIEAKVINENGKHTHIRKVSPQEWAEMYSSEILIKSTKK